MTDILHTGLSWPETRNKLKARREHLGMTQGDLARKMGTKSTAISGWERGVGTGSGMPNLDTLIRWHAALHMGLGFVSTPREEAYETPLEWNEVA